MVAAPVSGKCQEGPSLTCSCQHPCFPFPWPEHVQCGRTQLQAEAQSKGTSVLEAGSHSVVYKGRGVDRLVQDTLLFQIQPCLCPHWGGHTHGVAAKPSKQQRLAQWASSRAAAMATNFHPNKQSL